MKTIFATTLLTLVLVALAEGKIPFKLGLWLVLTLATFIVINEKFTRRERWRIRHYVVLAVASVLYLLLLACL